MLKYVLFDLDGTLLPLDQDVFIKVYFKELTKRMVPYGLDPDIIIKAVWKGTGAMIMNDGSSTNEELFWKSFRETFGEDIMKLRPEFGGFYQNEFENVRSVCGFNPKAKETVDMLKNAGITSVVATLPVFPMDGIESRIRWAGLDKNDFALITSYENCRFTKPSPKYYEEIIGRLGCRPEECLMVGNNVDEDMTAAKTGADVFLLTDCLINEHNKDISIYPHGSFDELKDYISQKL